MMLSRYEIARIVGLRALQLSEGSLPIIILETSNSNYIYTAAKELYERKLDVCVQRNGKLVHISEMDFVDDLETFLSTCED